MSISVLTVAVEAEHDLVLVRQRTRQLSDQLGLDATQQTRLSTAVSEISRNSFQYAGNGKVEFLVERSPQARLLVRIRDSGPGIAKLQEILEGRYRSTTGLGLGLAGAKRLVDHFEIETSEKHGTTVLLGYDLPRLDLEDDELLDHVEVLTRTSPGNPFGEVLQQNQELLRAQNELASANRDLSTEQDAKDRFLAMLAHELRNVLNALRSTLEVLKTGPGDEVRGRMEGVADQQVRHLERLVDDMLDASKVVRGTLELHHEPLDLKAEIETTAAAWLPQLEEAELSLELELPDEAVWVSADPTRIAQIFGNLISNARKFTDPGGRIRIALVADDCARVSIEDNGCGLDADGLSTMFTAFAQTEEARRRMTGGLGLGLAIVEGLVEAHGGSVEARSEGPGHGLTIHFELPLGDAPAGRDEEETSCDSEEAPTETPRAILLVDDHEASATGLAELLRIEGHEVYVAADGPEALELHAARSFDVVLCDLGLPEMDGFEVATRLGAAETPARLIAISGFVDEQSRDKALESGFERILAKPLDLPTLLGHLSREDED